MENLCLKIMNKNMEALAVARGENEVNLVYTGEYQEGDIIILEVSEGSHYAWLQWDDAIGKSMVYLTGNVTYRIPFGDRRIRLAEIGANPRLQLQYAERLCEIVVRAEIEPFDLIDF